MSKTGRKSRQEVGSTAEDLQDARTPRRPEPEAQNAPFVLAGKTAAADHPRHHDAIAMCRTRA